MRLKDERIVAAHVHDDLIIEGKGSPEDVCELMNVMENWASDESSVVRVHV